MVWAVLLAIVVFAAASWLLCRRRKIDHAAGDMSEIGYRD
jgi:hypothetical protein